MKSIKLILLSVICFASLHPMTAQNFPVTFENGKLAYRTDLRGNRIIDFSYCGYQNSEKDIPAVPNAIFVPVQSGDASAIIQRAINYVAALKPDANGFRGAVILDRGTFILQKSLWIKTSGVVLRGVDKNETKLLKKGYDRGALLYIEGTDNQIVRDSFTPDVNYIPVGQLTFRVKNTANLKPGDRIKILRPSTKEWIASIGCNIFGGGISALGWKPGDTDITWDRIVTSVNANEISIDAPLTTTIDAQYGAAKVFKYEWSNRISESGVEHLTMISDYNEKYPYDEDHCWTGISVNNAENCWVRQLNFYHFAGSAVFLQPYASKITVEDCISKDPVSETGGLRRMTFFNMGQLNLFQRCYSENGINDFSTGNCAPGPNAFVQCEAKNARGFSGSADAWACGLIFDIVNIDGNNLTFKNLGQNKNGAGWNTANSIFWQCSAAEIECYSPSADNKNYAYGCWAQFSGNGEWAESNNHVQPRSLFYSQLAARTANDVSKRAGILPKSTDASSSPPVDVAQEMTREAKKPLLTLEKWINQSNTDLPLKIDGLLSAENLKNPAMRIKAYTPLIAVNKGLLVCDGSLITGGKLDVQWWNGKLKSNYLTSNLVKPHITRFVPGREGLGLTDRPDTVISQMKAANIAVIDHNYGLWTDRRRDDHERIRRRDGDVWAPFYEQPFGRSGSGTAWDGLSRYDLYRPNEWYWMRLKEFANKAEKKGLLLFYENFFQHNIIEAGAHWVDCPWRTANNINDTGFPEPVNFTGDKRIFMADVFYDISNENRRNVYRNYIRQSLNSFAGNKNVVQLISAEYTGPLHFVEFWLDVIDEWQHETGNNATIALSCTKDVQDSILTDPKRAAIVDIIDIRYWHYNTTGLYAPKGGLNLAPRQHARLQKVGKVTFTEAYKAISEYRSKYPDKAITYFSQNYPEMAWAVLMAGGSIPCIPFVNQEFNTSVAQMGIRMVKSDKYKIIENPGSDMVIYAINDDQIIPVNVSPGKYSLKYIDPKTGQIEMLNKTIKINKIFDLKVFKQKDGAYWFQRLK